MEQPNKQELKQIAFTFLKSQFIAVISTVSGEITPESANVMYVMDDNWTIYIFTHRDSRKVTNIKINPKVALVVGTTLVAHTAQIEGTAQIIEEQQPDYAEITKNFQENKSISLDPIFGPFKDNHLILKIDIDWLRWLYFEQMTNKEVYTVLIP